MGSFKVAVTYFMTPNVTVTFMVGWLSLWPQKVKRSLEVAVTYFMITKVTVTFVVALTYFMNSEGHGVIRGRRDLYIATYEPINHVDLCGRFHLVYDPKRSRGH